jgi:HK97 family phage major capsid protein|nr:MAG TPA: major capsid protein [Caudoviricetes sp.]
MTIKEKLNKLVTEKRKQRDNLNKALIESDSKEERAAIGETLKKLGDEIKEVEDMLNEIDEPADDGNGGEGGDPQPADGEGRSFIKVGNFETGMKKRSDEDGTASLEYRKAFQQYLVSGKMSEEFRDSTKTTDAGAAIPENLVNRILEKFEQLGVIYNLVTKTSYPVGQTIPVDGIKPTATWVAEGAGSTPQKKTLSASIVFTNFKLRCEVRYTEEIATMSLSAFENLFVKQVGEAMLRAQESAIVDGDGSSKPKGILTETAPEGQAIEVAATGKLNYELLCDAEAAIPVNYEATAKWCMTKKTFMKFIGMTDENKQPIARINHGIDSKPERTLLGRDVVIYQPQAESKLGTYADTVGADTIFAFIVDFSDYTLNTNYNLGIQHAIDWDNEDHKTKAVLACDGKLITTDSLVTLTKKSAG